MKIVPFYSIICLHHVNLQSKERFLGLLIANGVQAFEGNQGIIRDKATGNNSTLLFRYNLRENHLEPICQNFRGNLVKNVAQADGSKFFKMLWLGNLGN
jgi:hypothetical protein